jgi:hypothetical protein
LTSVDVMYKRGKNHENQTLSEDHAVEQFAIFDKRTG